MRQQNLECREGSPVYVTYVHFARINFFMGSDVLLEDVIQPAHSLYSGLAHLVFKSWLPIRDEFLA